MTNIVSVNDARIMSFLMVYNSIPLAELRKKLGMDATSIHHALSRLEKWKLIERVLGAGAGRPQTISLNKNGREVLHGLREGLRENLR